MRIVFLDFGGVTHPNASDDEARAVHRGTALGQVRLDAFCWFDILPGLLAGHDDVFVVVHSNWRFSHSPEEIGDLLGSLGNRYLGTTPKGERYACIQAWLARHPTVASYIILDDSPSSFGDPPPPELILCDPRTGLSEPRVQQQIKHWLEAG